MDVKIRLSQHYTYYTEIREVTFKHCIEVYSFREGLYHIALNDQLDEGLIKETDKTLESLQAILEQDLNNIIRLEVDNVDKNSRKLTIYSLVDLVEEKIVDEMGYSLKATSNEVIIGISAVYYSKEED